jgi:hypothetical protein
MSTKKAAAPNAPPLLDVRLRYKIPESCRILKCSRSHFYKEIVGRIKLIREGACVFVPGSELARLADPDAPRVAVALAATAEKPVTVAAGRARYKCRAPRRCERRHASARSWTLRGGRIIDGERAQHTAAGVVVASRARNRYGYATHRNRRLFRPHR